MIVPGQSAPAAGSAAADASLPKIADHDLLHVIGRGAYGEVWLARHLQLGTLRAVKIVRRDQFGDARPFTREFDGIQNYEPISRSHPNLVSILHVGGSDDCFFYVMELADPVTNNRCAVTSNELPEMVQASGRAQSLNTDSLITDYSPRTLRSELKQHGALPIDRVIEIGHALASALAHLHAHKLVHRDVKPSNVIFVGGVPKLADIGLVAGIDDARSLVGTEGYVPFHGAGTPSADCYSLGKLLYELSTGHDRNAWPEPPANLATRPDRERLLELNAILHKACATDPRQRYANAAAMLADLELLCAGVSVKKRHATQQKWVWARKATLVLLVASFLLGAQLWVKHSGPKTLDPMTTGKNVGGYPPTTMRGTRNLEAWNHYKLGWFAVERPRRSGTISAEHEFREAIRLDPRFALAYGGLYLTLYADTWDKTHTKTPEEFRMLAAKMVELDNGLAETHVVLGSVKFWEWKWAAAEREFREALRLNPDCMIGSIYYGFYLSLVGRTRESLEVLQSARRVDPTHPQIVKMMGHAYFVDRDFTNALAYYREASAIEPSFADGHLRAYYACLALTNYPEAVDELETCGEKYRQSDPMLTKQKCKELREAFERSGPNGFWRKRLDQAKETLDVQDEPYAFAKIYARLGDAEETLKYLEMAYTRHDELIYLIFDDLWDPWREHPQFKALMSKVGLAEYEQSWLQELTIRKAAQRQAEKALR